MPSRKAITILALGDIVGKPGRKAVAKRLSAIMEETGASFVMANGENASGGLGLTPDAADSLLQLPISVLTTGNHIWKHKSIRAYLDDAHRAIRPANHPPGTPGKGWTVVDSKDGVPVAVINLQGLLFMADLSCPFREADRIIKLAREQAKVILVDFHAEATSEKRALGFYLDGKVSALVGTHTHIPTADAQVLPEGTGYLTDLGMCGPTDSVIGIRKGPAIDRFLTKLPSPFQIAKKRLRIQGAIIQVDPESGRCLSIDQKTWTADD